MCVLVSVFPKYACSCCDQRVLLSARSDSVKAIFLITDGFSNGGDPRPEARRLKSEGVKVFTFGIRNGNVRELWEMASEPRNETCYILNSFEEFEALARRALHSGKFASHLVTARAHPIPTQHVVMICEK